jgi:hypothetical protein
LPRFLLKRFAKSTASVRGIRLARLDARTHAGSSKVLINLIASSGCCLSSKTGFIAPHSGCPTTKAT